MIMKSIIKRTASLVLCVVFCLGFVIPAFAANENNNKGVTFHTTLSSDTLTVSDVEQTVTMTVSASTAITLDGIGLYVTWPSESIVLESLAGGEGITGATTTNTTTGQFGWSSLDSEDVSGVQNLVVATFTIPANTPAGTYTIGVRDIEVTSDYGTIWESSASASATLTITDASSAPADGYTASITGASTNGIVRVGNTLKVNIGSNLDFAATEMIITYDPSLVSFDEANSTLPATVNSATAGTLELADYGADKYASGANYVLAFIANAAGDAVFKITKAGFGTGKTAETANLTAANVSTDGITIAIRPAQVRVTFADDKFDCDVEMVEVGGTFTFYPKQTFGALFSYALPTASVNGMAVNVTATSDGGWKIENVSGAVSIDAAVLTPKSFDKVTYTGSGAKDITDQTETATYLENIVFTIPANKDATTEDGYRYDVTATIAGVSYTLAEPSVDDNGNRTYTIPGSEVRGAVIVSVAKTTLDATKVTVSIGGNASSDGKYEGAEQAGASIQVSKDNGIATLTVDTETGLNKGYSYEVKNGDQTLELDENGKVTIEDIKENTTITINKTVNVEDVKNTVQVKNAEGEMETKNFVALNGTNMWLIQMPNHVQNTETAVYKYNGLDMHWSEDYGTYVTVVISETAPEIDASKFSLDTVAATPTIAAGVWDVNKSGEVDANDAQLIWNMYNNVYQGFTENVTAEKFMLADANHDGVLDTKDAVVIITQIMEA